MKRIVCAKLHVQAKFAREHIFKLNQLHEPKFFRVEIGEDIEVTVPGGLLPRAQEP